MRRGREFNVPINPNAVNNIAPSEIEVLANEAHGPKYVMYRVPQGWGWRIRSGRGGLVPDELGGLYTSESLARRAIHAHEMENSTLYRINPEKQVA